MVTLATTLVMVLSAAGAPVSGAQMARGPSAGCVDPVLSVPSHGDAAVRALGAHVVSVAARHGTNATGLARRLRDDRSLWLDRCGELFFQDELPADLDPVPADTEGATWPDSVSYADAFSLHSRPGSQRVLYLDFDGQVLSGSAWNEVYGQQEWTAPPFSTDSDPTTFSMSERATVIEVWSRVSQDYAPFDIDVTTEDPGEEAITRSGPADDRFGTRVLITPDATGELCQCGGRAYIDVVDLAADHAYYQPAWVYPQKLAYGPKYIADAASHEAGHNFGLHHDGSQTTSYYAGAGGWGPIMGAPYGQAVTQWSDGSYPGANNTEDDLALIAGNGAPLVPDDVTEPMSLQLPASITGLVNGATDVDYYVLQAPTGTLSVTVAPHWPGPNLDAGLTLRDSEGMVVAESAPAYSATAVRDSVGASITAAVMAGEYVISVEGTGNGVPGSAGVSDYGSLGWYTVTASTVAASEPPPPEPLVDSLSGSLAPATTQDPSPSPASPSAESGPDPSTVRVDVTVGSVAALEVGRGSLPTATRARRYRQVLVASGGVAPYRWKRIKRALPRGLKLSRSGVVSGKAKSRGTWRLRVRVTDSTGERASAWIRIRVR